MICSCSVVILVVLVIGLALIAVSISLLGDAQFPGWVVILPTAGAALCLLAGAIGPSHSAGAIFRILDNPVSLWLGRVSYSMYLVHWPIVALFRYENGLEIQI